MNLVDLDAKESYVLDGRYVVNVMSLKPHVHFDYDAIKEEIEERMTHGHWVWDSDRFWHCSVCNEYSSWAYKYCPHCGAKMEVEE